MREKGRTVVRRGRRNGKEGRVKEGKKVE